MKNLTPILLLILMVSCKKSAADIKDYTCECTTTLTEKADASSCQGLIQSSSHSGSPSVTNTIIKDTKANAEAQCDKLNKTSYKYYDYAPGSCVHLTKITKTVAIIK